ncbi:MAG TPA: MBL fold metallo-hydrolase [Bryobacterales bacterium]|nr:MBL fold metallo-hydrolase [Bryobacterales bacterium]
MKPRIFPLALALLLAAALAPASRAADVEKTRAGDLTITPIHHASLMFRFEDKVIHIDPWSQGDYSSQPRADYIFITDIHGDHMDPAMIDKLRKDSTVVVGPAAVAEKIHGITVMHNGESKKFGGFEVEAVPMYNLKRGPQPGAFYHTKGRGNGYVFNFGGKRVYVSGDTEAIPEMRELKNISIAFICMNLPYTMTPEEAAEAVKEFRPKIVYPYHYSKSDVNAFAAALKGQKGIEVRLRDWY